jgi:hypothetical protein
VVVVVVVLSFLQPDKDITNNARKKKLNWIMVFVFIAFDFRVNCKLVCCLYTSERFYPYGRGEIVSESL